MSTAKITKIPFWKASTNQNLLKYPGLHSVLTMVWLL